MLTATIATPLLVALAISLLPPDRAAWSRRLALIATALNVVWIAYMLANFAFGSGAIQFTQSYPWVPAIGAVYHLGVDGISLALVAVTALVGLLVIVASREPSRPKEYFGWFLVLQAAAYGVFCSLDYLLFFVFWEMLLIPSYFLIAAGKGAGARRAALRFFLYTFLGSAFMLIGILLVYWQAGGNTFDIVHIAQRIHLDPGIQSLAFVLFFLGFAVKMPIFPLHGWLRESYAEAPAPVTMFLSGIVAKAGAYGFFRIVYPTLPDAASTFSVGLAVLATITILYGAFLALSRRRPREVFAYASFSHMGFVLLGLAAMTPLGFGGALFVMISHALISPLLFFLVGSVFAQRAPAEEYGSLRGLYTAMPVAGVIFGFAALANLGLPGLSAFVGEFFTLLGAFPVLGGAAVLAAISLVFTAAYNLGAIRQLLMGSPPKEPLQDLGARELGVSIPLVLGIVMLGVFPALLFNLFNAPVLDILTQLGGM